MLRRTRSGCLLEDPEVYLPYQESRENEEEDNGEGEAEQEEQEEEEQDEDVEEESRRPEVSAMERRLDAILKRQAKLERQVRAQARESPASDATSALERLAETMGKFNPQAVVPNNPGPYEGGQEFLRWKKYVVRCARANGWTVQELTSRMAQFLDGPAWATFERLRGAGSIPDTIEGLLDAIGAVHCDVRGALRDAKLRFRTRKQKPAESVHQFLAVFEALAIESQATEASKVQTFTD
jgi:hypothetical protein